MSRFKLHRKQLGQSMIEYTVVIIFGILTITSGPMKDQIGTLLDTIRSNYRGYSFAISISDIPDSSSNVEYSVLLDSQNVPKELKELLIDRTSTAQRSPADLQRDIRPHNVAPPNIPQILRQQVSNIRNISIP
jgi:hypothetical protein